MLIEQAKVLVVDDDHTMRAYVANALKRLQAQQVQVAEDGQAALAAIASFRPDVVLSDIHMAPMDGLEMVRRLRAHPNVDLRKTKVVFMSADRTPKTLSESVPLGIAGFIVKPPQAPALKLKLEQALKFCQ